MKSEAQQHDGLLLPIILIWLLLTVYGYSLLLSYESKPGASASPSPYWPVRSNLRRSNKYTLLMFLHPQCPCSRASLNELAVLLTRCPKVSPQVVFFQPAGASADWFDTELVRKCEQMPGCQIIKDQSGFETDLFNAKTSGQVELFDSDGKLLFSGGITAGRSHEGDNAGLDAVCRILREQRASKTEFVPVYGCAFENKQSGT